MPGCDSTTRYRERTPPRGRYKSEEEEARLRKRGLWVDEAPVPPWEWRKDDRAKL
jgi:endonuclease YncB( thermonuclease family)